MATKVKLMKFIQEVRGFTEISRRNPPARPSTLFLMQLRAHLAETSQSKHRLSVSIDLKDSQNIPHPVKITHLSEEPVI
jgi:hypothetical protein